MTDPPVEPPPVGAGAGQAPVRRPWHWRPASRAAVIGWWLASLAVVALLAVLTGVVVGGVQYAGTSGEGFADLAAIVAGVLAAAVVGALGGIGSALLLAARYVPPLARTAAWRAVFAILLAVVVVTLGVGVVRIEQLVVVLAVVVHALGVPALVASRVPVTAG